MTNLPVDSKLLECSDLSEVHRKTVAHAFWNSEVEEELCEQGQTEYAFTNCEECTVNLNICERAERAYTVVYYTYISTYVSFLN